MISVVVVSKDEPGLGDTLAILEEQAAALSEAAELIVVDASAGRLAGVAKRHPDVRWIDFATPPGVRISIPHQRNIGVATARGDIVIFTDAGCRPRAGWMVQMVAALRADGEDVVAGLAVAPAGSPSYYEPVVEKLRRAEYVTEAPTLNLAFKTAAFDTVAGFDETFEYGSDLDFTWRLVDAGFRIRMLGDAVVEHEWGSLRRQLKRAYRYGRGAVHLYQKHANRRSQIWCSDPVVVVYPAFIVGLPLTYFVPVYPLLLLLPMWRARHVGPVAVVADHLAFGLGALSAFVGERSGVRRFAGA